MFPNHPLEQLAALCPLSARIRLQIDTFTQWLLNADSPGSRGLSQATINQRFVDGTGAILVIQNFWFRIGVQEKVTVLMQ